MSTDLQQRPSGETRLIDWTRTEDARRQIASAVGATMDPEQFTTHLVVAFQNPTVRQCSVRSQVTAFMELAALGVLPTLNQAVLVPYKDQIKATVTWQGMKAIMERSPDILEIEPVLVHVQDSFEFRDGVVYHSFDPLAGDRGITSEKDIRGGYCKILYRNGRPPKYHFVPVAHIAKCRKCAQTQNVWQNWFYAMALKTVLRDCYARRAVPVDPLVAARLERAFSIDDVNLGNRPDRAIEPTKTSRILSQPLPPPMDDAPEPTPELPPMETPPLDRPEQVQRQREPGDDDEPAPPFSPPSQAEQEQARAQLEAEECLTAWGEQIAACEDVTACNKLERESLPSAPQNLRSRILERILARRTAIRGKRGGRQ